MDNRKFAFKTKAWMAAVMVHWVGPIPAAAQITIKTQRI